MASSTAPQWRTLCKQRVPDSANSAMWLRPMQPLLKLQNRVFNYRRKTRSSAACFQGGGATLRTLTSLGGGV